MSNNKDYQSIFVAGLQVDIANYLTEILIKNFLVYQKKPLPSCPFWQKSIAAQSAQYKFLSDKYSLEIGEVKNLLKVFDEIVLVDYFREAKPTLLKFLTKENKKELLYNLYNKQIKLKKIEKLIREESVNTIKEEFTHTPKFVISKKKIGL